MTPEQILETIRATPELVALVPDTQAIAEAMSVGRTKKIPTEVGNGTILEVLGLSMGNALLDVINTVPDFRYVKPLVEQGRLRLDSPLTEVALGSLVPTVLTQEAKDLLISKCKVADPIAEYDVRVAIFNDDGSLKV